MRLELILPREGYDRRFGIRAWAPPIPIGQRLSPVPPLHFQFSLDNQPHDFKPEMEQIVAAGDEESIESYLESRANMRNQLLYASGEGVPRIEALNNYISAQRSRVFRILLVYLMVDPWHERQNFVTQGVHAFLRILGIIEDRISEDVFE